MSGIDIHQVGGRIGIDYDRLALAIDVLVCAIIPCGQKDRDSESSYPTCISHCASCTQRNPKAPERSLLGAINKSLPCSVNLYAWGKYQIDPCGW